MSAELDCIHYVVIGIGINVNTTEFADEIKETASSLFVETGKNIKRSRIVALFAEEFTKYYQKFLNTGDLSGLVQDYNEMLINAGRQVRICDAKEEFTGVAAGIDSHGELLVTKEDGTQAVISAGEAVSYTHLDVYKRQLQDHGISTQQYVNQQLVRMSEELNIELVATNDIHYTYAEDADAHDILLCIQTGKMVTDENRKMCIRDRA